MEPRQLTYVELVAVKAVYFGLLEAEANWRRLLLELGLDANGNYKLDEDARTLSPLGEQHEGEQ